MPWEFLKEGLSSLGSEQIFERTVTIQGKFSNQDVYAVPVLSESINFQTGCKLDIHVFVDYVEHLRVRRGFNASFYCPVDTGITSVHMFWEGREREAYHHRTPPEAVFTEPEDPFMHQVKVVFDAEELVREETTLRLTIRVGYRVHPPRSNAIMGQSIIRFLEGKDHVDTKFILFNARPCGSNLGSVGTVYANSEVLKACSDYFKGYFPNMSDDGRKTFGEASLAPLNGPITISDLPPFDTVYDYDTDSDLDDGSPLILQETLDYALEHEHELDIDQLSQSTVGLSLSGNLDGREGFVIKIPDTAQRTWKALLYWIYTQQIVFDCLSSWRVPNLPPAEDGTMIVDSSVNPVSAKSIYRLAHKIGIEDLEGKAFEHITSQINKDMIVEELFSKFTSCHERVRKKELEFFQLHWKEITRSAEWRDKMEMVAAGGIPHADVVMAEVFNYMV